MTTAGRPTWDSAKGGRGRWEKDLSAMSKQYSSRDLPSHIKLKVRQEGQGAPDELRGKDFKRALEDKERRLAEEKSAKNLASIPLPPGDGAKRPSIASSSDSTAKRSRTSDQLAAVATTNLDMDDPWDEDYEDDRPAQDAKVEDSSAEDNNNNDNDDDDDDDDDDEELLAELAKIKRERAEEQSNLAAERKAAEETIRMESILKGNPLLNNNSSTEFKVKRRWDDDVVFKNCARGEVDHSKRGFINDTLRSDFHRKFMKKYIH